MADQERTLGIGGILALFFGSALLSAVFFLIGYSLGRSSVHAAASGPAVAPAAPSTKPDGPPGSPVCASLSDNCAPGEDAAAVPPASAPEDGAAKTGTDPSAGVPPPSDAGGSPAGGYTVQVAAISKQHQQDAEALMAALQKKQYRVYIIPPGTDAFFHVQIGPFSDLKDAEAVRNRLEGDGYKAILKK
jgi:cell division septation protein DedD